jgi:hypothetical protein
MRRTLITVLAALAAVVAVASVAVATGGGSTVTRARLERSLPVVFSHLYVEQAHLLGRNDVSFGSLHAKAACDKHGPEVADIGPGGDWTCLMSWQDPHVPMPPEGYGKFEVNVHSNDCYTAGGPTKLTGYLTMTDAHGREVTNPLFEFDGCFDPGSDTTATGVHFPSVLSVLSPAITPDQQRRVRLQLGCGTGSDGCSGTVEAAAGPAKLGRVPFRMPEESTTYVPFPTVLAAGTKEVTFQVRTKTGYASSDPVTLSVQGG